MPKYLKDVTFQFDEKEAGYFPHVAYCTSSVGGAASKLNSPVLLKSADIRITQESIDLMKAAKEIRIEMSMEEFLKKFMGMYWDDAALLAKMLGYESSLAYDEDVETYQSYVEEKLESFTLLKSLSEGKKSWEEMEYKDQLSILSSQEVFEEAMKVNETLIKGEKMTDKKNEQNVDVDALLKSVADLQKALDAEQAVRKALEEKQEKEVEATLVEKAKEFSFVEDAEGFGKLLKSVDEASRTTILSTLEKANTALQEAVQKSEGAVDEDMLVRKSASADEDAEEESATTSDSKAALKAAIEKKFNKGA